MSSVTHHGMEEGRHFSSGSFIPYLVPKVPTNYRDPVLSRDTFALDSFNLNSEVLCSFYQLDRNISNAAGIIKSVNWKDFRKDEDNGGSSVKNN